MCCHTKVRGIFNENFMEYLTSHNVKIYSKLHYDCNLSLQHNLVCVAIKVTFRYFKFFGNVILYAKDIFHIYQIHDDSKRVHEICVEVLL